MSSKSFSLRSADIVAAQYKSRMCNYWNNRYLYTKAGFRICGACCDKYRKKFALEKHWEVHEDKINTTQHFLKCTCCQNKIPRVGDRVCWLWIFCVATIWACSNFPVAPRKSSTPGKSAKYYRENPEAREKKNAYQRKRNKSAANKKYRAELNQERRDRNIYGKGGKDVSHKKDGGVVLESPKRNRARNGANGRSTKK